MGNHQLAPMKGNFHSGTGKMIRSHVYQIIVSFQFRRTACFSEQRMWQLVATWLGLTNDQLRRRPYLYIRFLHGLEILKQSN